MPLKHHIEGILPWARSDQWLSIVRMFVPRRWYELTGNAGVYRDTFQPTSPHSKHRRQTMTPLLEHGPSSWPPLSRYSRSTCPRNKPETKKQCIRRSNATHGGSEVTSAKACYLHAKRYFFWYGCYVLMISLNDTFKALNLYYLLCCWNNKYMVSVESRLAF